MPTRIKTERLESFGCGKGCSPDKPEKLNDVPASTFYWRFSGQWVFGIFLLPAVYTELESNSCLGVSGYPFNKQGSQGQPDLPGCRY